MLQRWRVIGLWRWDQYLLRAAQSMTAPHQAKLDVWERKREVEEEWALPRAVVQAQVQKVSPPQCQEVVLAPRIALSLIQSIPQKP